MAEELARARLDLEALLGRRVQATETAVILGLLQYHIRRSLQGCFGPALGLLGFARACASAEERASQALGVVRNVAALIRHNRGPQLSVDDIAKTLLEQAGLPGPAVESNTTARRALQKLVFASIGFLTCLYLPATTSPDDVLVIEGVSPRRVPATSIKCNAVLRLIPGMLRSFGEVFPAPSTDSSLDLEGGTLYTSRLSFFSLHRLSGCRIKWVDTLGSHLDFDPITKELVLFRFPSVCLLYSRHDPGQSIFHYILDGFNSSPSGHDRELCPSKPLTQALLDEVLLSYRLIFGQDRRSRKLFRNQEQRRASKDSGIEDPLLAELCTRKDIDLNLKGSDIPYGLVTRTFYSASKDFPLLGARLSQLQRYNMQQDSSTLGDFWVDRRNPFNFYTFWAVIIVGAVSVLLSVLQCAIGIAQLAVALRQEQRT